MNSLDFVTITILSSRRVAVPGMGGRRREELIEGTVVHVRSVNCLVRLQELTRISGVVALHASPPVMDSIDVDADRWSWQRERRAR